MPVFHSNLSEDAGHDLVPILPSVDESAPNRPLGCHVSDSGLGLFALISLHRLTFLLQLPSHTSVSPP